jgi:phage terminase large subunit-like protein
VTTSYSLDWRRYNQRRRDRGNAPLTEFDLLEEIAARRLARGSFIDFAQYVNEFYTPDPFHEKLGEIFDQVVAGDLQFVIINAPPQHGKSVSTSEILPAYWLGRRPNDPVVISSYNADLAHAKSREARKIVQSESFINVFGKHATLDDNSPVEISDSSAAVDNWRLGFPYRGGVRATGVGGGLTGNAAMLGIIDDPLKDIEAAQSAVLREKIWDWYRTAFRTRINEGGCIVIVMTRWHPEDLVGKLLAQAGVEHADKFKVFRFPAIAETQEIRDENNKFLGLPMGEPDPIGREAGEPLAPQRFSLQSLIALQATLGGQFWGALYDGVPRMREGNMFKRAWFHPIEAKDVPRHGRRVRYWDKAGTEGGSGAASAGVLICKANGIFYIEHVVRGWYNAADREKVILQTAMSDDSKYGRHNVETYIEQEPGSGGKESAEATMDNLSKHGFHIKRDIPSGNKDLRLNPIATQAGLGNVRMVIDTWNEAYLDEMTAIPFAARRDQGDATAGAANRLNDREEVGYREVEMDWS